MSELHDRRARKKARTRAEIRTAARRLFAERGFDAVTIADVAGTADVAVQTVFNHFATKEDLFFDGRTPWVEGPAEAVRSRAASVPPLRALREYLVEVVSTLAGAHARGERRSFIATIEASPALRTRELQLVHESEGRLAEALAEAWTSAGASSDGTGAPVPGDPATAAALTAATWLAVGRVVLLSQRSALPEHGDAARSAELIGSLIDGLLEQLEHGLGPLQARPAQVTGWPGDVRRAG